jgi:hypothetical protein
MYEPEESEPYLSELSAENAKLRETIRQQGEFIQSLREMIADFVYGKERPSLGLLHGRR